LEFKTDSAPATDTYALKQFASIGYALGLVVLKKNWYDKLED
jgi:hypothetical protein